MCMQVLIYEYVFMHICMCVGRQDVNIDTKLFFIICIYVFIYCNAHVCLATCMYTYMHKYTCM